MRIGWRKVKQMTSTIAKIFDEHILEGIPGGTWVAISHDQERVVGMGKSLDEALQEAQTKGEALPFVLRIPEDNLPIL